MPWRRERTPPTVLRIARAGCAAALVLGAVVFSAAQAQEPWRESPDQRRARLEQMSAAEKDRLLRQKERFDLLAPEEKQRLQDVHEALAQAPDGDRLFGVLQRYCEWLKTLSPAERAELAALSGESRIARIRTLMKEQEEQRVQRLANLTYAEGQAVLAWLDQLIAPHEAKLLALIPPDKQRYVRSRSNPEERRKRLLWFIYFHRQDARFLEIVQPSRQEIDRLVATLGESTREAFKKLTDANQQQVLVGRWIWAAVVSPAYQRVSDQDLLEFFSELPPDKQAELERMTREEMYEELRRQHFAKRFGRPEWGPGDGGPSGGRSPFRGNPFDRDDGNSDRRNRPRPPDGNFAKPPGD